MLNYMSAFHFRVKTCNNVCTNFGPNQSSRSSNCLQISEIFNCTLNAYVYISSFFCIKIFFGVLTFIYYEFV